MTSPTDEKALEDAIEKALTGSTRDERKNRLTTDGHSTVQDGFSHPYRSGLGYYAGNASDFDPKYAIDKERFWHFLETTQATELAKLQRQNNSDWKLKILERLDRTIKKQGVLRVLKKGLEIDDAQLIFFYEAPLASSNQKVRDRFASNEFSVTRQVHYSVDEPLHSIDMVVFVNGLAIATIELKNAWTGQTARKQGIEQYKKRDIRQALLQFGRCLVHFAADTDEVYMTTRLNKSNTFFLPFNQGNHHGKGNPVNPLGHKTSYLWEDVLSKKSVADIIQHFVRFDGKSTDRLHKRTLFFPRYHQRDVVQRLVSHAAEHGTGQTYLIQHSAGSGKSHSITWAAYQLIETYPVSNDVPGARDAQTPLFD